MQVVPFDAGYTLCMARDVLRLKHRHSGLQGAHPCNGAG